MPVYRHPIAPCNPLPPNPPRVSNRRGWEDTAEPASGAGARQLPAGGGRRGEGAAGPMRRQLPANGAAAAQGVCRGFQTRAVAHPPLGVEMWPAWIFNFSLCFLICLFVYYFYYFFL